MILVTGASGTNGSELIKLLSGRGVSVRGMVRSPRTHRDSANVEYITADFDDPTRPFSTFARDYKHAFLQ